MTTAAVQDRVDFDTTARRRRPIPAEEPRHFSARSLSTMFCSGAITIGVIVIVGWISGNAQIAAVFPGSKPVSFVGGTLLIVVGSAVLAVRGVRTSARMTAVTLTSIAIVVSLAELIVGPTREIGGMSVHPYPLAALLVLFLGFAIAAIMRRVDLASHVIASLVLLVAVSVLFGYVFAIPSFLDPTKRVAPVMATLTALTLLSLSVLLERPRGWVETLLSRTAAGTMIRFLLPAAVIVPVIGARILSALKHLPSYTPEMGLTLLVVVNVAFSSALILGTATVVRRREAREFELEKARRAAALYVRSLIETNLDPLVTISPAGKITDVNEATEAVTGLPRESLIGSDFCDYFTDPEKARHGYRTVLEQGQVVDYPLSIRQKSGRITDVLYNASLYRDEANNVQGVLASARDVTERTRAEEERRRAAWYVRSLIEASLDPLVTISPAGKITDVNAATEAVTGVPRERLTGTDFSDYFTEPDKARIGYRKVLFDGEVRDYPLSIRHTSGRITDVVYNASIFRDENGAVQGVFAAARDITERKRAEEERRAAARYARSLIEVSLDSLVTISPDGMITDVNAATEMATGVARQTLIGSDFGDYFTEPEKAREGYQRVLAAGQIRDYPLSIRHRSGHITDVLYNATVYRDEAGAVQGIFAAARDITERKRAAESAARLAALVEWTSDGIVGQTPFGVITSWNRGAEHIYGYTADEVIGRHVTTLAPPDRSDETAAVIERVRRGERVEAFESVRRRKDGALINVSLTVSPIHDASGNVVAISTIARDVTFRRQAEEQIRKAMDDLERSNRELEQFAYVASHDLQEPLRMVSSYTQLLAQRYADKLDKDANDFIGFAVEGANRMQHLITDLLMYSRVGTRGKPMERTDAHEALGRAIANLSVAIEESGAMVTNDDLPAVNADTSQLTQLFQNLVGNAVKFRKPGVTPHVHVSAERVGDEWVFSVKDNGIGIDPAYHERVFVIFQRLHRRDAYPGTGIGLAVCKRIVERHGGRIWLVSKEGEGATFFFTLPASAEKEES